MAHHDALTGLPNRNLLDDRLEQVLAQAQRASHAVALCLLDLDGFKPINDRFGHDVGDQVLKDVARRIAAALRSCDTVARFGGDEFVLLMNGFGDQAALTDVMQRVIAAVDQGFAYCEEARVTASIGVSIYQADARDATMLLRHADEAMYQAKAAGGNRFVVHGVGANVFDSGGATSYL
jgi:diguanylate cyclase (GGDEF)-like protein